MITNLVLMSIIHLSSNNFAINSSVLYINLLNLIHTDIFECTKPNYHKHAYYIKNGKLEYCYVNEANKFADNFWSNDKWEVGYSLSIIANTLILSGLNKIDKSGISGYVSMLVLNIIEFNAINAWASYKFTPKDLYISIPAITFTF